jgi:hypothetical protein
VVAVAAAAAVASSGRMLGKGRRISGKIRMKSRVKVGVK